MWYNALRHPLCGPPPTRSTNAATFRVARAPLSESPIRRDPHRAAAPTRVAAGRAAHGPPAATASDAGRGADTGCAEVRDRSGKEPLPQEAR